jgi:uncharacterized membrane protein HdeD (DUF308 family)
MDAKLSCLVKGLISVIFGSLALIVPDPLMGLFLRIFWFLVIAGIVLFGFLAITSPADESFSWFILSFVLIVIGIGSVVFSDLVRIIFLLAIAVLALYAGYTGIAVALTRPGSKYLILGGVATAVIVLLALFFTYVPLFGENPVMTVIGTVLLVFGFFVILLGLQIKEGMDIPVPQAKDLPHIIGRLPSKPKTK